MQIFGCLNASIALHSATNFYSKKKNNKKQRKSLILFSDIPSVFKTLIATIVSLQRPL